nr:alpha-L-arabinofuranosidase C-terminal domain-containing protein [Bifidobacterium avesanii]
MNARRYGDHPYRAKAFIGEYASLDDTWFNALAEAAFMTGLERTPAVAMACYAPLFNNVKYTNWKPDLIQFDGDASYGTPSYWAQWLFMRNQGEELLSTSDDVAHRETDAWPMRGAASIRVQVAYMTIDDLTIRTLDADDPTVLTNIDHAELRPDGERLLPLDTGDGDGFHLEFNFTVPRLPANPGPGDTDIVIRFAGTSDKDYAAVTINGVWGRMLTLSTVEHGKESPYVMDHMKCLPGERHHAVLEADHGHVTFRLDGREAFSQRLTPYNPDDLYYSVVRDADGTIVVKLVNVTDIPVDVRLDFDHPVKTTAEAERMDGFALDARNDFGNPTRVVPASQRLTVDGAEAGDATVNGFDYPLPPHAIHVLRLGM